MSNILILGAAGQIAKLAEQELLDNSEDNLVLYLRHPQKLSDSLENNDRVTIIKGDATSEDELINSMKNIDAVYANLAGTSTIEKQAQAVVSAMDKSNIKRLVWISTIGIYDEVPGEFGEWNNRELDGYIQPYAAAAKVIEDSDLDYTIIRPAWLTNNDEIDFEITQKGEPFKGTEVSRKSIAHVVVDLLHNPDKELRHSLGINKPNTDGDKPAWL